jgi:peptidylprolyl isomerase
VLFSSRRVAALLVVPVVLLAACNSSPGKSDAKTVTSAGVEVSGGFGTTPSVVVPNKAAPAALTQQTLVQGAGAVVVKGDTLVANYVGQTWAPKGGKPNVFDSSFAKGAPVAFPIGVGAVVPGWDKTLVGKKLGSRVFLTLPPADGYGQTGQPSAGIAATDTLVFVVDLVAVYKPNASAPGTVVANPALSGLPKITNVPGKKPVITSTKGVKAPAKATSTLIVTGSGPAIDTAKTLVLQLVEADLATGANGQATWGTAPQTAPAKNVLAIADKLTGQNIGSRAIVLLPPTAATPATATQQARPAAPAQVLVIDVVGQF